MTYHGYRLRLVADGPEIEDWYVTIANRHTILADAPTIAAALAVIDVWDTQLRLFPDEPPVCLSQLREHQLHPHR